MTGETAGPSPLPAAVEGRTPEELAAEYASGALVLPTTQLGDDPAVPDRGLFDGPPDPSSRVEEYPRPEHGYPGPAAPLP